MELRTSARMVLPMPPISNSQNTTSHTSIISDFDISICSILGFNCMPVHTFMLVSMGSGFNEKEVGDWVQTLHLNNFLPTRR
jgi:hypothetical protein